MNNAIRTYGIDQIEKIMSDNGQPSFRAKQLYEWLHVHHALTYEEMTNLPLSLRKQLSKLYPLVPPQIVNRQVSNDGTRKYVLSLEDQTLIETVGIPSFDKAGNITKLTVCLSSQAGCPMGCLFCATGQEGFIRNLTANEIIDQLIVVQNDFSRRANNIVVMGQGEPFLNYDEVIRSLRLFNSPTEFKIGARHITVSTCGILEGIQRLSREPEQFTLAVSLHAATQQKRNELMPHVANQPLSALKNKLKCYVENTRRRVSLEYLLIKNFNDTNEDIEALSRFCKGLICHVNLLTLNTIKGNPMEAASSETFQTWVKELEKRNIETTVRQSRGADIFGACGQLKNNTDYLA